MRTTELRNRQPTFDPPSIPPYDKGGRPRPSQWTTAVTLGLTLALVAVLAPLSFAADPADRLDRQVRVMERVLDEVLVQSPHVMVTGGTNTRGLVLDEFGALFTLDAALGRQIAFGDLEYVEAAELAARARAHSLQETREHEKEEGEEAVVAGPRQLESVKEWQKASEKKQKEHLDGIQAELIDALLDYGPTLGALQDDQWVAVAAFFDHGMAFRLSNATKIRRLVLKVKMRDLRQYNTGRMSRQEVTGRIKIEQR